jgi:hypothetical protein
MRSEMLASRHRRRPLPSPQSGEGVEETKLKIEDFLALVNSGFLCEKKMDLWCTATGDPYSMEKKPKRDSDVCTVCGAWTCVVGQ